MNKIQFPGCFTTKFYGSNFQIFHNCGNSGHTFSTVELFRARPEKLHREGQK